jgi:hypothetical protein
MTVPFDRSRLDRQPPLFLTLPLALAGRVQPKRPLILPTAWLCMDIATRRMGCEDCP